MDETEKRFRKMGYGENSVSMSARVKGTVGLYSKEDKCVPGSQATESVKGKTILKCRNKESGEMEPVNETFGSDDYIINYVINYEETCILRQMNEKGIGAEGADKICSVIDSQDKQSNDAD